MTTLTLQAPATETFRFPLRDGIDDLSAVASAIAELSDSPESRRAVAAITAMIDARAGHHGPGPDGRDVPLVVRQREFAVAARRLELMAGPKT